MRLDYRHIQQLALLVLCACLATACSIPPPPAEKNFAAKDHFQGKALELAQAVDRKDASAIHHLIKDDGVNLDTVFDQANAYAGARRP